jgi:hypothetical protein
MMSYADVLKMARQLPFDDQVGLAEALLRSLRTMLRGESVESAEKLSPLVGLSESELEALADGVVTPNRQQQLSALLEKNQSGVLSAQERAALDKFLAEADQVALLKARALYTLKLRGAASEIGA